MAALIQKVCGNDVSGTCTRKPYTPGGRSRARPPVPAEFCTLWSGRACFAAAESAGANKSKRAAQRRIMARSEIPSTCNFAPHPQAAKPKVPIQKMRNRYGRMQAQAAAGSTKYSTRLFLNSRSLKSIRYSLIPICDCIVLAVSAASSRVRQCIMEKTVYGQSGYAGRW